MKNFKKYLVVALCFGLGLSSTNANPKKIRQFFDYIKLNDKANALALADDIRQYYIDNGNPEAFGKMELKFQDAFGTSIAAAEARERGEGPEAELEEAAELIDEAQTRATQAERHIRNLQGNLDATEEGRQALERQLREEQLQKLQYQQEVAKINAEARKTKLDLIRLNEQREKAEHKRQTAERQAQENQNAASSSLEDLRAENNELDSQLGTLQEEHAATLQQLQACQAKNAELNETIHQQARMIRGLEKVANTLGKN